MSRQTVRHALKLLEDEGLIERRQGSGSYINECTKSGGAKQIAVVTTFLDDYIFPSILHDAQSCFSKAGYSTLLYTTENKVGKEREILEKLLEQDVSAVLIEGSKTALPTPNSDLYATLRERGIPVLFLHGVYSNLTSFPCLLDDNYSGGYQLAQYLCSKGHSKIAGIFKSDDIQGPQRYHGAVTALRDNSTSFRDSAFFWYDTEDRAALVGSSGHMLDDFINHRLADATAVICYNDEIAHLLIRCLMEQGKSVPEDVAVVSFDNSYYSQIGPVSITSLGHRAVRTGCVAANQLLKLLRGERSSPVALEWELIPRQSG